MDMGIRMLKRSQKHSLTLKSSAVISKTKDSRRSRFRQCKAQCFLRESKAANTDAMHLEAPNGIGKSWFSLSIRIVVPCRCQANH